MTATNHVLTGAVIAAAVPNPWIALPAALLSHLVLDALPHYGNPNHTGKKFLYILVVDAAIASSFLLSVFITKPDAWLLIIAAGVIAASPDLLWLRYWLREITNKPPISKNKLDRFLGWIQWGERPYGFIFEIPWGIAMLWLYFSLTY